ncbi:MAG: replication-associated recombination protein A [Saccharospirillaceae bacterium]|nr:replication-associated recombination protein A [Pseudomonadales bacterium]NRB81829.1 replication-associated recombination protein A [Saccharospirillaceae bacterium]
MDLFKTTNEFAPLAERMRAKSLDEYVGQQHILASDKPLYKALTQDKIHSMILWGPPGVGKTTLAKLFAKQSNCFFHSISAVLAGVKEIKEAVEQARMRLQQGHKTILFVDEVHRFNKAQQDAFLPHVEAGTFVFIGATTENPSFELNSALLSRARVYVLQALQSDDLIKLLQRALNDKQIKSKKVSLKAIELIAMTVDGDARRALNLLELACDSNDVVDEKEITLLLEHAPKRFDQKGDRFYDQISALHKSVRGSSPDGALYWFCRMLDGGCDPVYIARRVVRMASEDIGNADPRGLNLAMSAWDVQTRLGSPEGELAIAQAIIYLSCAPKSNAVYNAYNQVRKQIKEQPDYDVPIHIRNAPTKLMQDLDYGAQYRYSHDEEHAYSAGENYLPQDIKDDVFYKPVDRGLEIKLKQKLDWLKQLDQQSPNKRYE